MEKAQEKVHRYRIKKRARTVIEDIMSSFEDDVRGVVEQEHDPCVVPFHQSQPGGARGGEKRLRFKWRTYRE